MKEHYPTWIITASVLTILLLAIGAFGSGKNLRLFGILIDSRGKFSLSRLQIVTWTVVLLSAIFAILWDESTVSIYLPPEVWALMAISVGSTAGAVMIKDNKAQNNTLDVPADGKPRFSDFFKGDDVSNRDFVDISKVQMFFFTIVAVLGYVIALRGSDLTASEDLVKAVGKYTAYFPALSASLVTLIGISHAGYLTVKASSSAKSPPASAPVRAPAQGAPI